MAAVQAELAAFIEGVNPCVSFTDIQLSAILEEVREDGSACPCMCCCQTSMVAMLYQAPACRWRWNMRRIIRRAA